MTYDPFNDPFFEREAHRWCAKHQRWFYHGLEGFACPLCEEGIDDKVSVEEPHAGT